MDSKFDPKSFWDSRIESQSSYRGVGDIRYSEKINRLRKEQIFEELGNIISRFDSSKKYHVLDAGCGNGVYSQFYTRRGFEVTGIDFSPEATKNSKEAAEDGEYVVTSVNSLPFESNSFDIVHCFSVLYHIIDDNLWKKSISELTRVLRSGGLIIFRIEWIPENKRPAEHVKFRSIKEYETQFDNEGVSVRSIHSIFDVPRIPMVSRQFPVLLQSELLWSKNKQQKVVAAEL